MLPWACVCACTYACIVFVCIEINETGGKKGNGEASHVFNPIENGQAWVRSNSNT